MKKFLKREYLLIAFGVILFVVLNNLSGIFNFAKYVFGILVPVVAGFLIAFILNVPMKGFENLIILIFSKAKHKPGLRLSRLIALLLTFAALAGVVALACCLAIPMLVSSIQSIYNNIVDHLPQISDFLSDLGIDTKDLLAWFQEHDNVNEILKSYALPVIRFGFSFAVSAVSGIFTGFMIAFIAIYALLSKETLASQAKRICEAFLKEKTRNRLYYAARMLNFKYSKYLSGQFIEACILGVLGFTVLAIFGIPNAFVIAFLTALLAFVPYIGAFTAFGVGALLTALTDPTKLITYVLVVFIVQIVETQFICPHVVGNAVGLSPLWTLVAVFIGGNLFGLIGVILFIPFFSVTTTLFHEYVDNKLGEQNSEEKAPAPTDDTPPNEEEAL